MMITINDTPKSNGKQIDSVDKKNNYRWQGGCVILKDVDGEERAFRARYSARCPDCNKRVEIGQRIREHSRNNRRIRWAHFDCTDPCRDALPAMNGNGNGTIVSAEDHEARSLFSNALLQIRELTNRIAACEEKAPREVIVKMDGKPDVKIEGIVHPVFDEVLELAAAREPIFLPGPTGSGKSHLAMQISEALGLTFGSISCSAGMSEAQLLGRMVPHGDHGNFEFLSTPFLNAYENGGVFLFDEIDAADSNVLLVINSALANGHLSVPARHDNPVAKKHPDFICIAAGNTFGTGADRQYVGREQLDFATLSRFRIGTVEMDYDRTLEAQLCPEETILQRAWKYRDAINANRLQREMSTRMIVKSYKMMTASGWTIEKIESKWFQGWRSDEIQKVKNS